MQDNLTKQSFNITGMTCSACSAHVEKSVRAVTGVEKVQVNLLKNSMVVEYGKGATAEDIIAAVKSGGYGASLQGKSTWAAPEPPDETFSMGQRLIYSLCFLVPLMYIAMGRMWGLPGTAVFLENNYLSAFALTQLLLALPVIFINFKFFSGGTKALFRGSPNMDTLVATGSAASLIYGIYALYCICAASARGDFSAARELSSNLYFESSAMILTLITAGKLLEAKAKKRTSDAVNALMKLSPDTAHVIRNGKELTLSAEEIILGDEVVVRTGESFPCDGVIINGEGSADESAITGESMPVNKAVGDSVTGATILTGGFVTFRAAAVGKDTMFAKIIRRVEEASATKAPVARLADKVCAIFVPAVMLIALATFIIWVLSGYPISQGLNYAISVLVISCPCALGLATPTAIMAGTGRGAQQGILFKNAEVLEALHNTQVLVTDKTGTLTTGNPTVTDILPINDGIQAQERLLEFAAAIESKSEHPLARAIMKRAEGLAFPEITQFSQIGGSGVCGILNNERLIAGNESLMAHEGIDFTPAENLSREGKTVLYFALGGKYLGAIAVSDILRPHSAETINKLAQSHIEVVMLTGDNRATAEAIAKQANIKKVISQVKPQDKENIIQDIMQEGKTVAMVGDGINDAPALARAHIGIAIGGGTDAAMDSADVILMHGDFSACTDAIDLSRAVMRNIKQNLFWAFFYNVLGIPLAAGALVPLFGIALSPMLASAAMSMSSLFVVSNALRLRYFGVNNKKREEKKMTKTLKITGMMCAHCTGRVEKALNELEGVSAVVTLDDGGKAVVTLSKDVSTDLLVKTVSDAGYEVTSVE